MPRTQALGGGAWYQLHAHALNFPRFWGKSDIFRILSVYLTFNPGKGSAELREGPNNEGISGNEWTVFVLQWLTESSWPHSMFFTARRSRR